MDLTGVARIGVLAFMLIGAARAEAWWNVEKARDIGESVISGPTAQTFTSNAQKAKEVMARLGDALAQNRVVPNRTYRGRVRAGLTTGELTTGNCQWCAEMLREALRSAGVPDNDMFLVFGNVRTATVMGLNPFEVNKTHCALAVIVNGRPVVFDLWKHGMDKKSFAGARTSPWNGVSFAQWAVRLKHYDWFGFDHPTIQSATTKRPEACQTELIEAWKTVNKERRTAAPTTAPPPPTWLKSGTYQVSANGALLTWRIVVSGASISGKCDGVEPLSGSVSGNTLKVRRGCPGYDPPYQDYVGKLQRGQVVGKFTGAGGVPGERYDWSMRLSR